MAGPQSAELWVYIGTYTRRESHVLGKAEGIYVYRMDIASGALTYAATSPPVANPSFLAFDPDRRHLYCVNELSPRDGEAGGGIAAFEIDPKTGELRLINRQTTHGSSPCYLTVDATGRHVLAVNYGSGGVCVLPILENGGVGPMSDFVQHEGSSVNPQRQQGPHPHSITLDRENRFAYVPDLGLDKVMIYEFDADHGKLKTYNEQPWARTKSGAGPRHLAIHPTGKTIYVGNELDSTVTVFGVDTARHTLKEIQRISALPVDFEGKSSVADIHVHPTGQFAYASNRGHDSIAVFGVDGDTHKLTAVGHTSTQGKNPRNFAIDPSGTFLVAANQVTDDLHVFRIDQKTGKLTPTGESAQVPTPVCVKFVPR